MSQLSGLKTRALLRSVKSLKSTPWRNGSSVVLITPKRPVIPPEDIYQTHQILEEAQVDEVTTSALRETEAEKFLGYGFQVREKLHLLSRSTEQIPQALSHRVRSGMPWQNKELVEIDRRCFDDFWKFDLHALQIAKAATNIRTTRIVKVNGKPVGYAVSGVVDSTGYLQRLAVEPELGRQGIGTDLVLDSLRWLSQKGADKAMVNTQLTNQAALSLYNKLGFELEPEGLVILKWQRSSD